MPCARSPPFFGFFSLAAPLGGCAASPGAAAAAAVPAASAGTFAARSAGTAVEWTGCGADIAFAVVENESDGESRRSAGSGAKFTRRRTGEEAQRASGAAKRARENESCTTRVALWSMHGRVPAGLVRSKASLRRLDSTAGLGIFKLAIAIGRGLWWRLRLYACSHRPIVIPDLRKTRLAMSSKAHPAAPAPAPAAPARLEASNARCSLSLTLPPPGVCYPGQTLHPVLRFKGDTRYDKLSLRLKADSPLRVWGKDRWVSFPLLPISAGLPRRVRIGLCDRNLTFFARTTASRSGRQCHPRRRRRRPGHQPRAVPLHR